MRLLYLFPEEFRGNQAREFHVYRLANSLAAAGAEVVLAAADSGDLSCAEALGERFQEKPHKRLQTVFFSRSPWPSHWPLPHIKSSAFFFHKIRRWMESGDRLFDAAFTMHLKGADFLLSRFPACPLVFEAHEIFADSHPVSSRRHQDLLRLQKRVHDHAAATVALNAYLLSEIRRRMSLPTGRPTHLQHDGIDRSLLSLDTSKANPAELIYLGSFQPWKGVDVAVEAMRLLPDMRLTVVGGSIAQVAAMQKQAPPNVVFTGYLPREKTAAFLENASIGLLPNRLEPPSALSTFPLKLLEYAAAGKWVAASRLPVFQDLRLSSWIELVEPERPEELARAIRELAKRRAERAHAREWAAQFIWEKQGEKLLCFLESLKK